MSTELDGPGIYRSSSTGVHTFRPQLSINMTTNFISIHPHTVVRSPHRISFCLCVRVYTVHSSGVNASQSNLQREDTLGQRPLSSLRRFALYTPYCDLNVFKLLYGISCFVLRYTLGFIQVYHRVGRLYK